MVTLRVLLWFLIPLLLVVFADRIWVGSKLYKRMKHRKKINNLLKTRKMRKKIVAGNWKMNTTLQEGIALANDLKNALAGKTPKCDVVVCTPFISVAAVAETVKGSVIGVGAEDCSANEKGAFTGEVSASMVASTGAKYCIVGQSVSSPIHGQRRELRCN